MNIPEEYDDKFRELLNELEDKTGNVYKLCIIKSNNDPYIINSKQNKKIEVKINHNEFGKLRGIYDNVEELKEKLDDYIDNTKFTQYKEIEEVIVNNEHIDINIIIDDKYDGYYTKKICIGFYEYIN